MFKLLLFVLALSSFFHSVNSFACGDISGCTGGFTQDANGSFHVKDFNNSDLHKNFAAVISSRSMRFVVIDTWPNGSPKDVIVYPEGGGPGVIKMMPPSSDPEPSIQQIFGFYPTNGTMSSRNFYVRKELLAGSLSDSNVPLMQFVSPAACTGSCRQVIGNLDSAGRFESGATVVSGWACDRLVSTPIAVHVYANGPAGTGQLIASGVANRASKDSAKINARCGTTGSHRFKISIPPGVSNAHRGQKIYVHGISKTGPNLTIAHSGQVLMPDPKVKGYIDGFTISNWNDPDPSKRKVSIRGWACQEGINSSIRVQVFAGGSAGNGGVLVAPTTVANLNSEAAVSAECGTTLKKHRFNILLNAGYVYSRAGQRLFVHGLSTDGSPNLLLQRSGYFSIPIHFNAAKMANSAEINEPNVTNEQIAESQK
jgi:hypothetical protein